MVNRGVCKHGEPYPPCKFCMREAAWNGKCRADQLMAEREVQRRAAPYPWCIGSPTIKDCIEAGYCKRNPNCGD